jgi:peptidoglycan hydrolase-like protein with peptidoglycan-binding domain
MRMTRPISSHRKFACGPTSRGCALSLASAFLWINAFAFAVPTVANAQSWMKSLEQAGKQIIDRTVDQVGRPSEGQPGQQTAPAPQPPSGSNPSHARAQVREVQRILLDLGYKPGAVDGTYVPATATAIRAYQSENGLQPNGVPSGELLAHLRRTQNAKLAGAGGAQSPARSAPTQQTPKSDGGMVAPAPEGAPITAGQERSPANKVESLSQSSSSPASSPQRVSDIDPAGRSGTAPGALSDDVIPIPLLLYKYAPDAFTDKYLLEKAREQIGQDQWAYKHPNNYKSHEHVFVFSREQVEGRAAEFAAKELLPVYKSYLARLTNQIPARLNFKSLRSLAVLEYSGGALRAKSQPYLTREFKLPDKRDIPRQLQSREILGNVSQISGRIGNLRLGDVTKSLDNRGRGTVLALDRDPEVPPIAMKSADAERMWKKPECSSIESTYMRDGATRTVAAQAASDCRSRQQSYSGGIKSVFEIEIDRVTVTERNWIVEARLIGASVYGPHQELLKTFGANDFVSVQRKLANEQQKETQAAEERRSKIAELAHMDLLGVRLGMSVKEAEAALRAHQKVETVYRFSAAPSPRQVGAGTYFEPYNRGLLFIANEGKDVIALFFQNENSVIGISRRMLANDLKNDSLTTALTKKYGKPTHATNNGWIWGQTEKGSTCAGDGNIDARSKLELVEGQPVANVTYKAAGISVRPDAAKADAIAGCNTVLQVRANLVSTAKPNVEFRLFNHSTVAETLRGIEGQTKSRATKAGKDLDL